MLTFFTSDLRHNLIKIACLTIALTIGTLLIAKAFLEQTYDSFFPAADRIYIVTESALNNQKEQVYDQTAGGIAPGLKQYVPQVEAATRHTVLTGETDILLNDGRTFSVDAITLADSCYFDVLPRPILAGDPHTVLALDNQCMIPRSLAEKIGGDVIGMEICSPQLSTAYRATIGGIYEDFPHNSIITNDIFLSLPTIRFFMTDGRQNWWGNDRYLTFVRLAPGATPDDLKPHIQRMLSDNVEPEILTTFRYNIGVRPLVGYYTSRPGVRTTITVLALLAAVLLVSAWLNYLLIVMGQMGKRGKEMAVRKCFGTSNARIFGRLLGENFFFLSVSAVLALLLAFSFSNLCNDLLGYTTGELFSTGKVWMIEAALFIVLLMLTGALPAWLYCRTPVAQVFRRTGSHRRGWKLAFLSVQFFASGLLLCLLSVVGRQYHLMTHFDMGYDYNNLAILDFHSVQQSSRAAVASELSRLGCVASVTSAECDLSRKASGNNVWLTGNEEHTINVADMYYANGNFLDVLDIPLLQGRGFSETADSTAHEVLVEERFIDVLSKLGMDTGDGNVVGRTFNITEHLGLDGTSEFTICGVIGNIHRGGLNSLTADNRAGVIFPSSGIEHNLYIRFHRLDAETLAEAQEIVDRILPDNNLYVLPFRMHIENLNDPVRKFGTSVLIAGMAVLLITLIGLMGYTSDEVRRRAKEIAIRKINGTSTGSILRMFCSDILKVALPSLLLGGVAAVIVARRWLAQFTEQVSLSPGIMVGCILGAVVLLLAVVVLNALSVARSNPVEYLRAD